MADEQEGTGGGEGAGLEAVQQKLGAEQETIKLTREKKALIEAMEKMSDREIQNLQQKTKMQAQNLAAQAEMFAQMGQISEAASIREQAEKAHQTAILVAKQSIKAVDELTIALQKAEEEGDIKKIAKLEKQLELEYEKKTLLEGDLKRTGERLAALKEVTAEFDNMSGTQKKMLRDAKQGFLSMGKALGGITLAQNTYVGSAMMTIRSLATMEGGAKAVGKAFFEVFNIANIGASITQKVIESFIGMFLAMDKAGAEFAAATGAGNDYRASIEKVAKANSDMYVSVSEVSSAYQGLLSETIGFTQMSDVAQQSIAGQVAQFERLGVKSVESGQLMNIFRIQMGTTAQGAVDLQREFMLMGAKIGISSKKMIKDFKAANKTLASYGKQGKKVFTNLAAMAKATGVEMNTLIDIGNKFDTFESAADTAAGLNAMLGSNISALELNRMSHDKRIETVIREIQVSGKSFKHMHRYEKQAIATKLGIQDLGEAERMLGGGLSGYRQYQKDLKNAATEQAELEKAVKATADIQRQFQMLMVQFAPDVEDFLVMFKDLLDSLITTFRDLNESTGGYFPYIVLYGGMAATAIGVFGLTLKPILGLMGLFSGIAVKMGFAQKTVAAGSGPAAKGFRVMSVGLRAMGKAGATAVPFLLATGAAALMIGGGIAIAAYGVAQLVMAFAGLGPAATSAALAVGLLIIPFVAFFAVMALVVYSGVGPLAAGVMLAMGAAALMLGIGIAIAALGVSVLVKAIGGLGENGMTAALAFLTISQGMALMVLSAAALAIALYFLVPVLASAGLFSTIAAAGFGGMALAIGFTAIAALLLGGAFMVIAEGLSMIIAQGAASIAAMGGLGKGLAAMALGVAAMFVFISNPLGWLAIGAAMAVMANGLGTFVRGLNAIDDGKLEAIAKLSDVFEELQGTDVDATIIANVTKDLVGFKEEMDATTMAKVATLGMFGDVFAMNTTRAETRVQNQMKMPENITVQAKHTIHTKIGDKEFTTAVKESVNKAKWGKFDAGPLNIVAAGDSSA